MFYTLMIPALFFLIWQILRIKEIEKHDKYLFEFCQVRRDAITYLSENIDELSKEDYSDLRRIISALSTAIAHYKTHKTIMFDFRAFSKFLRETQKSSSKVEGLKTSNQDIRLLARNASLSFLGAFVAFTPFIRSELAFRLIHLALSTASKSGSKKIASLLPNLDQAEKLAERYRELDAAAA